MIVGEACSKQLLFKKGFENERFFYSLSSLLCACINLVFILHPILSHLPASPSVFMQSSGITKRTRNPGLFLFKQLTKMMTSTKALLFTILFTATIIFTRSTPINSRVNTNIESSPDAEVSTTQITREYPCPTGYTLHKRYTPSFTRYYICELRTRTSADIQPRGCPEGFFENGQYCTPNDVYCPYPNNNSPCAVRACGTTGEYRVIQYKQYCFYCPDGYVLDEFNGQRSCYGVFQIDPECLDGFTFSTVNGSCQ